MKILCILVLLAVEFNKSVQAVYEGPILVLTESWNLEAISTKVDVPKKPGSYLYETLEDAGKGVDIYVLEKSVALYVSEFGNRASLFARIDTVTSDGYHGTCVASIAAGKTYGIATKANIRVILSDATPGLISGIIKATEQHIYKKEHHEQFPDWRGSVIVIAGSGGYHADQARDPGYDKLMADRDDLIQATKMADEAGVIIVSSAGNSELDVSEYRPFKMPCMNPGVICVGGASRTYKMSDFSNYGVAINIWAPGEDIWCATPVEGKRWRVDGTSLAAPQVAGVIAGMLSYGQPYHQSLVDNTFHVKLTLFGNALSPTLRLPEESRHTTRRLFVNTGIENRQARTPFKEIDVSEAVKWEEKSPFQNSLPPLSPDGKRSKDPDASGSPFRCYWSHPDRMISFSDANKLWLRLRWELGHVNGYNNNAKGYQKLVPCINSACVYFFPSEDFRNRDLFLPHLIHLEKYVRYLKDICKSPQDQEGLTGGRIYLRSAQMYVVLRRKFSAPSLRSTLSDEVSREAQA